MVVWLDFDGSKFVDNHFLEIATAEKARMSHFELFEEGGGVTLFSIVLVVADEEGTGDMEELSIHLLHWLFIINPHGIVTPLLKQLAYAA